MCYLFIGTSDDVVFFFFFFNDTATTEIYTLSLHDALPIFCGGQLLDMPQHHHLDHGDLQSQLDGLGLDGRAPNGDRKSTRLNSSHSQISYAVFCLKKKKKITAEVTVHHHTRLRT